MDTILPSQPAEYKTLLRCSLKLYRASLKKVLLLTLLLTLIVFIPRILSDIIGQDLFSYLPAFSPQRLWLFAIDLAALVFFVAMLWRVHCVIRGYHEPLFEDLKIGLKKACYVFVASIIQSFFLFTVVIAVFFSQVLLLKYDLLFGTALLGKLFTVAVFLSQVILIFYVSTLFLFLVPLIATENKGILIALQKSISLGWNHFWRIISLQSTPWICYLIALSIAKYLLNIDVHIYFVGHGVHTITATIFNMLLFFLFIPWVATLLLTQLNDLELRKQVTAIKQK